MHAVERPSNRGLFLLVFVHSQRAACILAKPTCQRCACRGCLRSVGKFRMLWHCLRDCCTCVPARHACCAGRSPINSETSPEAPRRPAHLLVELCAAGPHGKHTLITVETFLIWKWCMRRPAHVLVELRAAGARGGRRHGGAKSDRLAALPAGRPASAAPRAWRLQQRRLVDQRRARGRPAGGHGGGVCRRRQHGDGALTGLLPLRCSPPGACCHLKPCWHPAVLSCRMRTVTLEGLWP